MLERSGKVACLYVYTAEIRKWCCSEVHVRISERRLTEENQQKQEKKKRKNTGLKYFSSVFYLRPTRSGSS